MIYLEYDKKHILVVPDNPKHSFNGPEVLMKAHAWAKTLSSPQLPYKVVSTDD